MNGDDATGRSDVAQRRLSRADQWLIGLILWGDLAALATVAAVLIWRN